MFVFKFFILINVVLGLIKDNTFKDFVREPTKNYLMNIKYKNENLGLGVHIYHSFVVTLASFAVLDRSQLKVISLSTQRKYDVIKKQVHRNFTSSNFNSQYNIAVLKIDFQSTRRSILLDPHNLSSKPDFIGSFSGWSWTEGDKPEQIYVDTDIMVEDDSICQEELGKKFKSNTEFCASHRKGKRTLSDAIPGSPLFYHHPDASILIGLLSWSRESQPGSRPVVFVKISKVRRWIRDTIEGMCDSDEFAQITELDEKNKITYVL